MLVGTPNTEMPSAFNCSTALATPSGLRLATTTRAPALPRALAIACPMPRVPPVTMATLPVKSKFGDGMRMGASSFTALWVMFAGCASGHQAGAAAVTGKIREIGAAGANGPASAFGDEEQQPRPQALLAVL